jgi:hypothetical protein
MFVAPKAVIRPLACALSLAVLAVGVVAVQPAAARTSVWAPPVVPDSKLIPKVRPATADDLEFRPGALTIVTDTESGGRYWVFTYIIANKTGKTQRFSPRFDILMGDGVILQAGKDVPVDAARRMQRAVTSAQALDQFQVMGDILDGESNAREGFVIWPAKGDSKDMTLFVSGMSSAFDRRTDPATGKEVIVRRSWSRHYAVPGESDPRHGTEASFDPIKDQWLMR